MGRIIGFKDFPKAWDEVVVMEFNLKEFHTKTARYISPLEKRTFDLYAPLFLLPDPDNPPKEIIIALGKSSRTIRAIGFHGEIKPLQVGPDICEYEFNEEKVNSIRYELKHEGQSYYLYIPNEVFERESPPTRVFIQVAVTE